MTRKPKVVTCPDHYTIAFEAIGILRPLNCGIDDTDEAQTVISLVAGVSADDLNRILHVTATISKVPKGTKVVFSMPEGVGQNWPRYLDGPILVVGSAHEKAIQVAYYCLVMAKCIQGGEE
jgi:hypothetical protein